MDERKQIKIKRTEQLRKKKRRERINTIISICSASALLIAVLFLVIPFFKPGKSAMPLDEVALAPVDKNGIELYTPVPTPTPTPVPTPVPTPTPYPYQVLGRNIDPAKKMLALTFDDGPSKKVTRSILKTLSDNDSLATFFMVGEAAMKNGEVVREVKSAGHQIGTHSYDHQDLTKLTEDQIKQQIDDSCITISNACGVYPAALRPPYGSVNDAVRQTVDMPIINWSVDTNDWKYRDAKKVYEHIMANASDGAIILMHDLYSTTAEAVIQAVPALIASGYQLVTIDELFMYRGPELAPGKVFLNATLK